MATDTDDFDEVARDLAIKIENMIQANREAGFGDEPPEEEMSTEDLIADVEDTLDEL